MVLMRRRLDPERHGSAGYTSIKRLAAMGMAAGFLVLATHLASQAWYNGRMLPGVMVAGEDLSGLTLAEARGVVQSKVSGYRLKLKVADQPYELTAAQVGVTFDAEATVQSAYRSGRSAWLIPMHHEPLPLSYRLDRSQLNAFARSVADRVGTPPIDAGIVVKAGKFTTVEEKSGWSIDRVGLIRLIEDDVRSPGGARLELQPREQLADIRTKALEPTIEEARHLMATPIILSYADRVFTPTPAQIGQWLAFQKQPDGTVFKLIPQIDTAELKDYVQDIADKINIAPVNKKVNVENGVSKTVQEGVDGLAINQDAVVAAVAKAVRNQQSLAFDIPSAPVPFKTISTTFVTLDYGRYIEVNISKQRLWVWQDHTVIYETPITTGATGAGMGTVTGLFSVYYKTTNTRLRGQGYDVPVKYWMPFHLGYGMHDAVWRNGKFGGQDYYYGGSHGCVNLPDAAAEFIYNWSEIGTPVWVHS